MQYVALLRGIGPGNPNMRNDKLRGLFEGLGFTKVQSIISSGNIIFESAETNTQKLETTIEQAFPAKLGYNCTVIIRTKAQLESLLAAKPFKGLTHGTGSYLMATFFQKATPIPFKLPYHPAGKPYKLIGSGDRVVFSVTDNTAIPTTDLMGWLEKQFGKQISSRTWKTVDRIFQKMTQS